MQRPVRADVVVVVGEGIELALQCGERLGGGLLGQVALERLVQALDLAAGLGVVGARVLELDAEALELVLPGRQPPRARRFGRRGALHSS